MLVSPRNQFFQFYIAVIEKSSQGPIYQRGQNITENITLPLNFLAEYARAIN